MFFKADHEPFFTRKERILIENEASKIWGTPMINWMPEKPLRRRHAYCYVINRRITRAGERVARLARKVC
jgi:hypothetical protein